MSKTGNKIKSIYFFALAACGEGISGGDRIFIELARVWGKKFSLNIITTNEGERMCQRQKLSAKKLKILTVGVILFQKVFAANYFYKILLGIKVGLTKKLPNDEGIYLYSASHFWMDFFPAFLLKLRYPKTKWLVGWFQTAPNPLKGFSEGEREDTYKLTALAHWVVQFPLKPIIRKYAEFVFVNNIEEKKQFPQMTEMGKAIVLIGAVRLDQINSFRKKKPKKDKVTYDAVFQGRFHPQKGVIELIDIWSKVVNKRPTAKLAMIGDGSLFTDVKRKIDELGLRNNVKLFGYVFDGKKKYEIFSQSKLVVHPAFYDSGGMASAEAMAFELPVVGFNLKSYESYYPRGMVKVKKGNLNLFAEAILRLLTDDAYYKKMGREAYDLISNNWSWEKRASEILENIQKV
jgi:glycosyltransferase involved in cell wall biosynthesis